MRTSNHSISAFPARVLQSGLFVLLVLLVISPGAAAPENQTTCGIADALDYPIEGLVPGYDDFGAYRERFDGNHTGLDMGFDRWYDPVYAAARGRVTYADPEAWDTEKGVVILQHTFPDNSIIYSVYGHMEETDTILFPQVGTCVERGAAIGAIGWPSRGRPHLHYEIRNFLPSQGGPGYVLNNPLDDGWYDPLDFTALWRARFNPAFVDYLTSDEPSTLPPLQLESGVYMTVSDDWVSAMLPPNQILWRIKADSPVTGLAALPGDIIAIHTQGGQVSILQGGHYQGVWSAPELDERFLAAGDTLVFLTRGAGLAAYDTAGNLRWQIAGTAGSGTVYFGLNGTEIGWAVDTGSGILWRMVSADGQIAAEIPLEAFAAAEAEADGSWLVLGGAKVMRLRDGGAETIGTLPFPAGNGAEITSDKAGNLYAYLNDSLLSLDSGGALRWQSRYSGTQAVSPLIAAGCALYTLDDDGMLRVFQSGDGASLTTLQLYAGGRHGHSSSGRLLHVDEAGHLTVSAGFLTIITLDGSRLGNCS